MSSEEADIKKIFDKIKGLPCGDLIFESPDEGKTIYARIVGTLHRTLIRSEGSEFTETTKS